MAESTSNLLQVTETCAVVPYQFEPSKPANRKNIDLGLTLQDQPLVSPPADRVGNVDWCKCGHCIAMETWEESNCCTESWQIRQKVVSRRPDVCANPGCITDLPGFQSVCLDVDVLHTAYMHYKEEHGGLQATQQEKYRYTGYRQLVRWCYGTLGKKIRVPLPSCAVNRIRNAFPSENYRGFRWPKTGLSVTFNQYRFMNCQ